MTAQIQTQQTPQTHAAQAGAPQARTPFAGRRARTAPVGSGRAPRAERILMMVAGGYHVLLASVTLFLYSGWFLETGYTTLEDAGEISSASVVNQVSGVIDVYGAAVLLMGLVTLLVATVGLRNAPGSRKITGWLVVCAILSLVTADFLGVLLLSVVLAVRCARLRALRLAS
ncbi:hypothetical protein ACXET9_03665 [Brachybacterium sp. DNPG3]